MLDDTSAAESPTQTPEEREALRIKNYYDGKQRQYERQRAMKELAKKNRAEEKAQREAEKALKAEQQINYGKLTPAQWRERYGTEKPKVGIIDHETAVKMISRRMTSVALHTLAEICQSSRNDSARVSAAREILDRGWGKAHLLPEGENKPGAEITITFGNQDAMQKVIDHEADEEEDLDENGDEIDDAEAEEV